METNGNQIEQKTSNNYCCKKCNYITVRKPNYERHLLTSKHLKETNGNQNEQKRAINLKRRCAYSLRRLIES